MDEFIDIILDEAGKAFNEDEIPIGAVVINNEKIISRGHNSREKNNNILGHAEINAIIDASKKLGRWNLSDCDLYVTLKPCSMCLEVIKQARIKHVYYLLDKLDYKKEYNKTEMTKLKDRHEQKYSNMLTNFFKNKR